MSKGKQFAIHVTEKVPTVGQAAGARGPSIPALAIVCLTCLTLGIPGIVAAWPDAVAALRQSGRLVQSNATITETRIVEVPHPDRDDLKLWRKEGLCEFQALAVSRERWLPLAEYHQRSKVVPGGVGESIVVWFDPETSETTIHLPNRAGRWFLLMFYMVLCLGGLSSGVVLLQRLLLRYRPNVET